jgi:predicted lipoprotein with Yx(FWY)xxD motif
VRPTRTLAIAGALMLALAACGSDEPAPAAPAGEPTPTAGAGGYQEPGGYGGGGVTEPGTSGAVQTGETDLGTILVDAQGLTLYMFGADQNGTSTCYDDCAATWPALTVDGKPKAGADVDASLLSTTERDDGTTQVTYAGLPLYHFASDSAPGDTKGQGIGDIWFVVSPEGDPIR